MEPTDPWMLTFIDEKKMGVRISDTGCGNKNSKTPVNCHKVALPLKKSSIQVSLIKLFTRVGFLQDGSQRIRLFQFGNSAIFILSSRLQIQGNAVSLAG